MQSYEAKDFQFLTEPVFIQNPEDPSEDGGMTIISHWTLSIQLSILYLQKQFTYNCMSFMIDNQNHSGGPIVKSPPEGTEMLLYGRSQ